MRTLETFVTLVTTRAGFARRSHGTICSIKTRDAIDAIGTNVTLVTLGAEWTPCAGCSLETLCALRPIGSAETLVTLLTLCTGRAVEAIDAVQTVVAGGTRSTRGTRSTVAAVQTGVT